MAKFDFFVPVSMLMSGPPAYGYITQASPYWIQITGANWQDDYFGSGFTYSGNAVTGGVLTDYYGHVNSNMVVAIQDMQVSASAVASFVSSGDLFDAMKVMAGGNDVITSWEGNDQLLGWAGNDQVHAGYGNDDIWGGEGADVIDGGAGIDFARYDFASSGVYVRLDTGSGYTGEATGDVLQNIEGLVGSAYADVLVGDGGNNTLLGGAGNDVIIGGLGNDIINGNAGVDTAGYAGFRTQYSIGFHGQTVSGPEGVDQLTNIEIIQFADGRMVYDQGDAAAIAYRMYDSAFGRAPDSYGENGWTTALQKGLSVADMASGFAASQEFVATYGPLDNQHFVEQLYRNVLDREGEGSGVAAWTNALNTHAMSRGQVLAGFSELNEHVQKLAPEVSAGIFDVNETAASVARLYDATFNRLPDANGLVGWKDAVDHGMSLSTVADGFAFSAEFQNTYGNLSNQGFVEQLYHNVLDRAGEAAGVAGWTAALNSGQMDRGDVLLGFSESLEHQTNTASHIDHGIWIV